MSNSVFLCLTIYLSTCILVPRSIVFYHKTVRIKIMLINFDMGFLQISYSKEDSVDSRHPLPLEDFLERIKYHWVERCTLTRSSRPFSVEASFLPLIIAPKLRGKVMFKHRNAKEKFFFKEYHKCRG